MKTEMKNTLDLIKTDEMLWGKKIHKFENAETIQSETVGGKEKWEGRKEGRRGEREVASGRLPAATAGETGVPDRGTERLRQII